MDQPLTASNEANPVKIEPPDPGVLAQQLDALLQARLPARDKIETLLQKAVGLVNAAGIIFFRGQGAELLVSAQLLSRQTTQWSKDPVGECRDTAVKALSQGRALITPLSDSPSVSMICCPVPGSGSQPDHCLTVLAVLGNNPAEPYLIVLQMITTLLLQVADQQHAPSLHPLLEQDFDDGWQLGGWLKQWSQCAMVVVGTADGQARVRVHIVSDVANIDKRTHRSRLFLKVMRECCRDDKPLVWPIVNNSADESADQFSQSLLLKELVLETGMKQGAAFKLTGAAASTVLLIMLWPERREQTDALLNELQTHQKMLTPAWYQILRKAGKEQPQGTGSRFPALRKVAFSLGAIALLGWFFFYPMKFVLHPDCLVEPVRVRFLVAQFDALIKDVFAEPGDSVAKDQPLVVLDGREIELELNSLAADSEKSLKMRDKHHVRGDVAAAQMAQLEYQRLQERAKLLHIRQSQLELTSPIDGIVLSGDLKRRLGGPVSKGQVLLELAPLETVLLEMGIADEDIGHVRIDQPVTVRFDAFPQRTWQGAISDIAPKSELVQGRNMFIVTFELANSDNILQPGMQGRAAISCGTRSPAWIYFHKPWYATLGLLRTIF